MGDALKHPVLLRLDSAHDAEVNFNHFPEEHYFLIKRNLRKDPKEQYLALVRRVGRKIKSREGKNVFVGELHHKRHANKETRSVVPVIYKVTERLTDSEGKPFLIPEVEVEIWWRSLMERYTEFD